MNLNPHQYKGPLEDLEKKDGDKVRSKIFLVGLAVLIVLISLGVLLSTSSQGDLSEDDVVGLFGVLPVIFIAFFPIFFMNKKKNQQAKNQQISTIIVAMAVLFIGGLVAFLIASGEI